MKFMDSLRRSLSREPEAPPAPEDFAARIRSEGERLQRATAGRLDAEVRGLDERLRAHPDSPEPRDLGELIAVSGILADRYHYRPLQRWAALETFDEALITFSTTYDGNRDGYALAPADKSWREHLMEFVRALHLGELFDDPLQWLVAWRPSEPREHLTKIDVLRAADLGTLTNILVTMAEWEIEQYKADTHATEPNPDTVQDLWQGLNDTREMRLAITDAWCRHPRIPVDYAEAVREATPERQLDFLQDKLDQLIELAQADALEKTGGVNTLQPDDDGEDSGFALYS
jgi:hypothetical protein